MPRFPLTLGAITPPPTVIPPPPPFWSPVGRHTLAWQAVSAGQMPRFEHIWPQEPGGDQQFVKITEPPIGAP